MSTSRFRFVSPLLVAGLLASACGGGGSDPVADDRPSIEGLTCLPEHPTLTIGDDDPFACELVLRNPSSQLDGDGWIVRKWLVQDTKVEAAGVASVAGGLAPGDTRFDAGVTSIPAGFVPGAALVRFELRRQRGSEDVLFDTKEYAVTLANDRIRIKSVACLPEHPTLTIGGSDSLDCKVVLHNPTSELLDDRWIVQKRVVQGSNAEPAGGSLVAGGLPPGDMVYDPWELYVPSGFAPGPAYARFELRRQNGAEDVLIDARDHAITLKE